ncbi:MAG: cytochrome D ubiquinol oxidase subunit II [Actinobacteria bacterium]|nr:cytochrome D ubiquinol oxidase subunit II [Actinomycetota bacterium]
MLNLNKSSIKINLKKGSSSMTKSAPSNLVKEKISTLLSDLSLPDSELLNDCIHSIIKMQQHNVEENDLKLLSTALEEFRDIFKLFQRYRDVRKITIFGSARCKPSHPNYILAEQTAKSLSKKGYMIITGAGPGIMEAGNKGALLNKSFGLNILLPFEQLANQYIEGSSKLISFKYFFTRKLAFIRESDGTVLFPGGFGTHDEGFELLTLIQTGRCAPRPFILINHPDSSYWQHWKTYVQNELLEKEYISKDDMSIFSICDSVDDVEKTISQFYHNYHSIRYTSQSTFLRLNHPLSETHLKTINQEFKHLITHDKFSFTPANTPVKEDPYFPDKPKLIFQFNRTDYSGLYPLIYYLNSLSIE